MATNIWQRLADRLEPHTLVGESGKISALMALRNVCIAMAAEDAEREGQHECPTDIGVTANCPQCECVPYEKQCAFHADARLRTGPLCDNPNHYDGMHSGFDGPCVKPAPAPSLPPLDPALVEECCRAFRNAGSITHEGNVRAALTHYRTRVEVPLREELWQARETSKKWLDGLESAERNVAHFRAEADRLRAELAAKDNILEQTAKALRPFWHEGDDGGDGMTYTPADLPNIARSASSSAMLVAPAAPQPTDEEWQRLLLVALRLGAARGGWCFLPYECERLAIMLEGKS